MPVKNFEKYRQQLVDLRDRLKADIAGHLEAIQEAVRAPGDDVDVTSHPADRDIEGLDTEVELGQRQHAILGQVEAALDRIDHGSYGRCESCGQEIASARLNALPYAGLCIRCEELAEAEGIDAVAGRRY
ncbi:MAG TPA: TraR/DksA family transcriptional regulator [Planctomycetaceae bacterium]|nr:TraR/DksA family transcriptional regulator [Planctomycetaceae bacterium]